MAKFEVAITKAQTNNAQLFESENILVTYSHPEPENPYFIEGTCDISKHNWKEINLTSKTKFEMVCISGSKKEIIFLGDADPSKSDFLKPREFSFSKQNRSSVKFVLKVFEEGNPKYIASSSNIKPIKLEHNEKSLFKFEAIMGNYAWDTGFQSSEGPIIYLNKDKLKVIDEWITNNDLLWRHIIMSKALKDGLLHYFQQKNNSGQDEEAWVKPWDIFIEKLGFELDESLFSEGLNEEIIDQQAEKADEIVDKYCELDKTINSIERVMSFWEGDEEND
tara:strand:- start:3030 stop:3863 length:834 start_codon:yes stop_codon:yes gene_type:complete